MLVRQEHLNQYGSLFAGRVLSIIDELAFVACARAFPGRNFVTRAVRNAEFIAPAMLGNVLEFTFGIEKIGVTSVTVRVRMIVCKGSHDHQKTTAFDGDVVMVCVNKRGRPAPVKARRAGTARSEATDFSP